MPELPDVELFKHQLDQHGLNHRIDKVTVSDKRILGKLPETSLRKALEGQRLERSLRHGKHLLARIGKGGWMTFHFGMTGALQAFGADEEEPRYTRVRLDFADGSHLAYINRRMLGHVGLTDDAEAFFEQEKLGPDALDPKLDQETFMEALGNPRRSLKSALMDQSAIAGIGNIYADEIHFQAKLHPETKLSALSAADQERLFKTMRSALKTAVEHSAGSEIEPERLPESFLLRQRHKGGRCPRCGGAVKTVQLAGRTTYFCPSCQKPKG